MFSKIVELLLRDKPLIAKLRKNIVNNGRIIKKSLTHKNFISNCLTNT